ncbi:MAG: SIMPL domain-containing protein [Acidimicrobiales bacterium]|jgi:uncharacterized protein YggE|nr:SIMPL domain-containing protein [Actinomycetota bacterium]
MEVDMMKSTSTITGVSRRRPLGAVALGAVALAAGSTLAACSSQASAAAAPPSCSAGSPKLTLQGNGLASAPPNLLTVVVEVDVTKPSASSALADDNAKTAALSAALVHGGVASKDIQTSGLSIQPQYNYPHGVQTLTGYSVSNTVTAKIHDLATAGSVVDSLGAAAGNAVRIDALSFSVQDPRSLQDQARADAVKQAVSHAQAMATAAGERLGPVCSITDDASVPNVVHAPAYGYNGIAAGSLAAPSASVPLSPGTEQQSASVTMVYSLVAPRAR